VNQVKLRGKVSRSFCFANVFMKNIKTQQQITAILTRQAVNRLQTFSQKLIWSMKNSFLFQIYQCHTAFLDRDNGISCNRLHVF